MTRWAEVEAGTVRLSTSRLASCACQEQVGMEVPFPPQETSNDV